MAPIQIDWEELFLEEDPSLFEPFDFGPDEGSSPRERTRQYLRFDPPHRRTRAVPGVSGTRPVTYPAAKADGASGEDGGSAAKKRSRDSGTDKVDAILHMLQAMNNSVQASLKSAQLQQVPKEASPSPEEIFEALKAIPKLARADLLSAYSMLTRDDRQFRCLMALPMSMRKDWLLMEIGNK